MVKKLTPLFQKSAKDGTYPDGGNLYWRKRGNSASYFFRFMVAGSRHDIAMPVASLLDARKLALDMKAALREGRHPRSVLKAAAPITWEAAANDHVEAMKPQWKSPDRQAAEWQKMLAIYCSHLNKVPLQLITQADYLKILSPVWITKHETGRKLLHRMQAVLQRQVALGTITHNPIAADVIKHLLPRRPAASVEHHGAVRISDAPSCYASISNVQGMSALCLRWAVLTAVRSGDARYAAWNEINLDAQVWDIPASRTKTQRPHVVPLTPTMVEFLNALPRFEGCNLLFPNSKLKPLTDMALLKVQKLVAPDTTVHGWRSTFRDYCGERGYDRDLVELCLSHSIGTQVERAYARSALIERRRPIMGAWCSFLTGHSA